MHPYRKSFTPAQAAAADLLTTAAVRLRLAKEARKEALRAWHTTFNAAIDARHATVPELADASGVDRNYIDQARVREGLPKLRELPPLPADAPEPTEVDRTRACGRTAAAGKRYNVACDAYDVAMRERNALMVETYRSDVLGPTAIAVILDVDRNHVMRCNRTSPGYTPRPRSANGAKGAAAKRDRKRKVQA